MPDLSVVIPARNEAWLAHTVADVCANRRGDTEVIVIVDGVSSEPIGDLSQYQNVRVEQLQEPIGQRAATNLGARLSTARYVMKLDGHAAVAPGFDLALMQAAGELGPDCTQIPAQRNLHVYDQVCDPCGFRADQAPNLPACPKCSGPLRKDLVWETRKLTTCWRLDHTLHFQYDSRGQKKQTGDICDVMSALGACFFMERDRFWYLEGLDEDHGSWGNFGAEIALKSWLSGGRHVVNKRTYFAHFFRVGNIGFPYPITGAEQDYARQYSRNLWMGNNWPKQTRPLRWLVEKFRDTNGWTAEQIEALPKRLGTEKAATLTEERRDVLGNSWGDLSVPRSPLVHGGSDSNVAPLQTAGLVYYSDCRGDETILNAVREQLDIARGIKPLIAVTLKPIKWPRLMWGDEAIVLPLERGYLAMFKQILAGLEALDTEIAFLVEHDVLYHPSHFDFVPPDREKVYYNQHVYKVNSLTGRALHYRCSQTSGLCADRRLLVEHYRKRVAIVEERGFSRQMGFEPATHNRPERVDDLKSDVWMSPFPNIDIRHDACLTPSRWHKSQFRNQRYTEGWTEADNVPGWPPLAGRPFADFLQEAVRVQQAVA